MKKRYASAYLFCLFLCVVDFAAIDHKSLEEILGREVEEHIEACDDVVVPEQILRQKVAEDGRGWGEYAVVAEHLQHRSGDVGRRLEGEFAVECEVPQDGEQQRGEVASVVGPRGELG